jgi:hypothetical protein
MESVPVLQAPTNTLLLLDETNLVEGKLDNTSLANLHHIQDMITHQRLAIHGVYADSNTVDGTSGNGGTALPCHFSVPISNGIMVISKGKSILSGLTAIKVGNTPFLSVKELNETICRAEYLEQAQALVGKVEFPKELTDEISKCYLDARASNHLNPNGDSLSGLVQVESINEHIPDNQSKRIDENTLASALNITRLLTAAMLKGAVGKEEWEEGWRLAQMLPNVNAN